MTPQRAALAKAWSDFCASRRASLAVSLAYNPERPGGTASPTYRFSLDGECLPFATSGLAGGCDLNRLPTTHRISLEQIHKDLDRLHRDVDRKLYRSHYHKRPEAMRSSYVGFVEHPNTNAHMHLLWTVTDDRIDECTEALVDLWTSEDRFRSARVRLIRDGGWGEYVAKSQWGVALDGDPALFVVSRRARS